MVLMFGGRGGETAVLWEEQEVGEAWVEKWD